MCSFKTTHNKPGNRYYLIFNIIFDNIIVNQKWSAELPRPCNNSEHNCWDTRNFTGVLCQTYLPRFSIMLPCQRKHRVFGRIGRIHILNFNLENMCILVGSTRVSSSLCGLLQFLCLSNDISF